ncbi:MAG: hypothetical protein ABSB96_10155 [Gaiellaceae bacterium]
MPEETSASDRYLAEVDRLLGLRGRSRRRTLATVRKRLLTVAARERKKGASESKAETLALADLGSPEQLAAELRERALTARARKEAQIVLAAFVPIALAMLAVALEVIRIRHFRQDGTITIEVGPSTAVPRTPTGFFHYYPGLGISLPPLYLAVKLVLGGALVLAAVVLAESAIAFTRHRRLLSAGLTLLGGVALVVAVSLQIALAFEWNRLRQGHSAWLFAATLIEAGTVLILAVFLARPARTISPRRLVPLASAPMFVLFALVPLLAVTAKSGWSSTDICPPDDYCGPSYEEVIAYTANHEVSMDGVFGPAGEQGAVALKGKRLAFVASTWRNMGLGMTGPEKGPVDLVVVETRWSLSARGPCGRQPVYLDWDRLAPTTNNGCQVLNTPTQPGVSWRVVRRLERAKAGAVAIAYRSDGRIAIAYSRPDGVWLAEAPSWRPQRLLDTTAVSIRLTALPGGELSLAAVAPRRGGSQLELLRTRNGRWTEPVIAAVGVRSELMMVSRGEQTVLLYRDRSNRLVLDRRSRALALLARRPFAALSSGALGALRGDGVGIAIAAPLANGATLLEIYRTRGKALEPLTRERLPSSNHSESERLFGVAQTGSVVRALFGHGNAYHPAGHIAVSFWTASGGGEFASDWPRWAILEVRSTGTMNSGRMEKSTEFDPHLAQPPERQLLNENGSN